MTSIVEKTDVPADARLPTSHGEFRIRVFHDENTGFDHVALTLGEMDGPDPVLVRVHSECLPVMHFPPHAVIADLNLTPH